jgi:HEAT repeat protein
MMKHPTRTLVAVLIIMASLAGCGDENRQRDKKSKPKGIADWAAQLKGDQPKQKIRAVKAIRDMGAEGGPGRGRILSEVVLYESNPKVRGAAIEALKSIDRRALATALADDVKGTQGVRKRLAGEIAQEMIEGLGKTPREKKVLKDFGQSVAGGLSEEVPPDKTAPMDADFITDVLKHCGESSLDGNVLRSLNEDLRIRTRKMGPDLWKTLDRRLLRTRIETARMLAKLDMDGQPAVLDLLDMLYHSQEKEARKAAFETLLQVDDLALVEHLTLTVQGGENEKTATRVIAIGLLRSMGPRIKNTKELGQQVGERFKTGPEPNENERYLIKLGKDAGSAISELGKAVLDKDPEVRAAAFEALQAIDPQALPPALAMALQDPRSETRRDAVNRLKEIGSRSGNVAPKTIEALGDNDGKVADGSEWILTHQIESGTSIRELVKGLKNAKSEIRRRSARILGSVDRGGESVPGLTEVLLGPEETDRRAAGKALARIFSRSEKIDERRLIESAREVLRRGGNIKEAAPAMKVLAGSGNDRVAIWGRAALALINKQTNEFLRIVSAGLEHQDWWIRSEAVEILPLTAAVEKIDSTAIKADRNPLVRQKALRLLKTN